VKPFKGSFQAEPTTLGLQIVSERFFLLFFRIYSAKFFANVYVFGNFPIIFNFCFVCSSEVKLRSC